MKKTMILFLGIAVALLMGCSENASFIPDDEAMLKGAKKPMPKLVGTTTEYFSPLTFPFIWVGTIEFTEGVSGTYSFAYELLEFTQKDFSNAGFFTESFYVYDGEGPVKDYDDGPVYLKGTVLLKGTNSGMIVGGKKFVSNGVVEEASKSFEGWVGRKAHVNGYVVEFYPNGDAEELSSTFRIN